MMFGFSNHRREQLTGELRRMADEFPRLGVERAWLHGDLANGTVTPTSELGIVVVHPTSEPFHRRADFFVAHLRPAVGTRFIVYTPAEFNELSRADAILVRVGRSEDELGGN